MLRRGRLLLASAVLAAGVSLSSGIGAAASGPPTVSRATAHGVIGKYRITVRLRRSSHINIHGGRTRMQAFEIGDRCAGARCELAWLLNGRALGVISQAHGRFHTILRDRSRCATTGRRTVNAFHVTFTVRGRSIRGTESLVNTACGVRSSELVAFTGRRVGR